MKSVTALIFLSTWFTLRFAFASDVPDTQSQIEEREVEKYALIIAAEHYNYYPQVKNSIDDGIGIGRALASRGFNLIRLVTEPTSYDELIYHIKTMRQQAGISERPAILFLYFAGHGMQSAQFPYIVPLDATKDTPEDSALSLQYVMTTFSPTLGGFTAILIDACRKEGPQTFNREDPGGVLKVSGGILGMATKAGALAQSVSRSNSSRSPYSLALESELSRSNGNIDSILQSVAKDVEEDTIGANQQSPDLYNGGTVSNAVYLRAPHPARDDHRQKIASILELKQPKSCLKKFLQRRPAGPFSHFAFDSYIRSLPSQSDNCSEVYFE
jgi:hypothetical protein